MRSYVLTKFAFILCLLNPLILNAKSFSPDKSIVGQNLAPIALRAMNLSDTSAILTWVPRNAPQETEWDLEIVRSGTSFSGVPTHPNITSKNFLIDTLSPGVRYYFRVRAICSGIPGGWAGSPGSFFTHILNGAGCNIRDTIPDLNCASPRSYPIEVRNAQGNSLGRDIILKEVQLIIEHNWLTDLEIKLASPSGDTIMLLQDNGGQNANFGNPSDETCTQVLSLINESECGELSIAFATPPFTGKYLPLGNLNSFNKLSDPNGTWELIICDDAGSNIGTLNYVNLVFAPVSCTSPTGLSIISIDSTSVTLDWAPGGFCNQTVFEIGSPGFTPGDGDLITAGCPPFKLEGLTGGSNYEVLIFENCGGGNFSDYACNSVVFETICSPPPITLKEDFDDLPDCLGLFCSNTCDINGAVWQNDRTERIDWSVLGRSTYTGGTGPSDDMPGGGNFIYLESNSSFIFGRCNPGSEAILKSDCIMVDTRNSDTCHVSFNYHMYGNFINTLAFQITTDGNTWETLWSKSNNQGNIWHEAKLSLSGYNGQIAQFRFIGTIGNGNKGDIALDNIIFYGSTVNYEPTVWYADEDDDGYGNSARYTSDCFSDDLPGYSKTPGDCNDNDDEINPGVPESPCDFIDKNCNGFGDENFLYAPITEDTVNVCDGEQVILSATPQLGIIIWYDEFYNELHRGNTLTVNDLLSNGTSSKTYTFYADEAYFTCFSEQSAEIKVTVHPQPKIIATNPAPICAGSTFDLRTILIDDQNNSPGDFTYHSDFPTNISNKLSSPMVSPFERTTYFIKKTSSGDCSDITSVTVDVLPAPQAQISPNDDIIQICKGESVFLRGMASGGIGSYDIIWSTLQTNDLIFVNSSSVTGNENLITFSAADQNGCMSTDSVLIKTVSSVDTVQIDRTPASVCNGTDGSIELNPIDGIPNFTYEWEGPVSGNIVSAGSHTISGLSQGSYSITISDQSAENCPLVLSNLVIDGPSAKVELDTIIPVSCNGFGDGSIFLTVTGNNPTIEWSPPISGADEDVRDLFPGTYSVTVSDGSCSSVLTDLEVTEPDSLTAFNLIGDVSCFGESDGFINIAPDGGTPPYQYNWHNAPPLQNATGLPVGFYQVTVSDKNSCEFVSKIMEVQAPEEIDLQILNKENPKCYNSSSGSVSVEAGGGKAPYLYFWSDNGIGKNRTGLPAGNYSVTIQDAVGCLKIFDDIELFDPPEITFREDGMTEAKCFGSEDGAFFITVSGGTGDLSFLWSNNTDKEDLINTPAGIYFLEVTDDNGCIAVSDSIEIGGATNFAVELDIFHPTCAGRSDGTINLTINAGGTAPYEYIWSDNSIEQDLINIGNGLYGVTITDSEDCIFITDSIEVSGIQRLNDNALQALSPVCNGDENGIIFSNISGGTPPYKYLWNDNSDTPNMTNLSGGDYLLTVTDANDCVLTTDTIAITEPDSIDIQNVAIDQIDCNDQHSGSITVQAKGGEPGYNFEWNGGTFSGSSISDLPAGDYELVVTDQRGCRIQHPKITLNNPPELIADYQVLTDDNCNPDNRQDTVLILTSGGTPLIKYEWSNGTTQRMLTNMKPGEYSVTLMDGNGCMLEIEGIKVPASPNTFRFDDSSKKNLSCHGTNDGEVEFSFEGGTAPFQYLWSSGIGDSIGGTTNNRSLNFSNLEPGEYSLFILDANECPLESNILTVFEPEVLRTENPITTPVPCFGGVGGTASIDVLGGIPPLRYQWKNSSNIVISNNKNPGNLPIGNYNVTIIDSNDCQIDVTNFEITQPDSFYVELIEKKDIPCKDSRGGVLDIEVHGGTSDYFIKWESNNFSHIGSRIEGIEAGIYTFIVNDANNCVLTDSFEISEPKTSLELGSFSITEPLCFNQNTGSLAFSPKGGTEPYTYFFDNTGTLDTAVYNIGAGTYSLMIFDSLGCKFDSVFKFNEPAPLEISGMIRHAGSWSSSNGEIDVNIQGGTKPYTVSWLDGGDDTLRTGLTPNSYFLSVLDANGCSDEEVFVVTGNGNSSANDLIIDGEILLAPNPTSGLLKVIFKLNTPSDLSGKLFSVQGGLIQSFDFPNHINESEEINLTEQPSGVYYFTLKNETGWRTWKIIKI